MKRFMCVALVLALSMVVLGGCKKKEAKPEEKAAGVVNKLADTANKAVSNANKAAQDATKK